jgi:hypothetical protein
LAPRGELVFHTRTLISFSFGGSRIASKAVYRGVDE